MAQPIPYKINVPQSQIDTLQAKLASATFPDELEDSGWDLGTPLADIKRLAKKWETWDWRIAESKLNELPMFEIPIEVEGFGELDIHFVWKKSGIEGAIPLLFVHGWPGSFIEVTKLLPHLTTTSGTAPVFDVIAPSLPNFGFSSSPKNRGFNLAQYAETCHKLMLSLGYPQYVTQGGDWGFFVTRAISALYPQSCKASHINMILASAPKLTSHPLLYLQHALTPYGEREKEGFKRTKWFWEEGRGYNLLQSTKPQTIGYALQDSPVALLAWIYEKLHDWTDSYPWTDDDILTWISIYAYSRAGPAASSRIYYEVIHTPSTPNPKTPNVKVFPRSKCSEYINVPLGLMHSPKELFVVPKTWGRTLGNVVYERVGDGGGHFFAWERPEGLVGDLRGMFGKGGGAYGVVEGKDGYGGGKAKL